jgi:hypothetical protein
MGVRIALQCSEADSQLILSDENLAARLLSRPGEAIYNDAGGRLEGNSPFQVAYLPDEKRDTWLDEAARRSKGRFDDLPRIVFEGDARASLALHPARKPSVKPDPRGNVRVWLGEAVAILGVSGAVGVGEGVAGCLVAEHCLRPAHARCRCRREGLRQRCRCRRRGGLYLRGRCLIAELSEVVSHAVGEGSAGHGGAVGARSGEGSGVGLEERHEGVYLLHEQRVEAEG